VEYAARKVVKTLEIARKSCSKRFRHLKSSTLRWVTHHGSKRLWQAAQICQYDIVLASYHTIASEWQRRDKKPSAVLLNNWHRIVLDEGRSTSIGTTKEILSHNLQATRFATEIPSSRRHWYGFKLGPDGF
jgi:SNF2 family DNA or RNA helicase